MIRTAIMVTPAVAVGAIPIALRSMENLGGLGAGRHLRFPNVGLVGVFSAVHGDDRQVFVAIRSTISSSTRSLSTGTFSGLVPKLDLSKGFSYFFLNLGEISSWE